MIKRQFGLIKQAAYAYVISLCYFVEELFAMYFKVAFELKIKREMFSFGRISRTAVTFMTSWF